MVLKLRSAQRSSSKTLIVLDLKSSKSTPRRTLPSLPWLEWISCLLREVRNVKKSLTPSGSPPLKSTLRETKPSVPSPLLIIASPSNFWSGPRMWVRNRSKSTLSYCRDPIPSVNTMSSNAEEDHSHTMLCSRLPEMDGLCALPTQRRFMMVVTSLSLYRMRLTGICHRVYRQIRGRSLLLMGDTLLTRLMGEIMESLWDRMEVGSLSAIHHMDRGDVDRLLAETGN
mmetsp:Transcript_15896/g.34361  ORF Transcript_15896/g.34361 Transcript_15896/m.34361 type:complete len:227 (-) Transcript_15896:232-912(-)